MPLSRYLSGLVACAATALTLAFAPALVSGAVDNSAVLGPTPDQRRATALITHLIGNYHYKKTTLDDGMSADVLERFLKDLDPNRSYFLASDIESFQIYRDRLDDALRHAIISPAFNIHRVFRDRLGERVRYATALLGTGFDFKRNETYAFDRSEADWAANRAELDEIWRKRVKNDFLSLRLSGKEDAEIKDLLRKRYEQLEVRTGQTNEVDVFQRFINAYTSAIEPHTTYLSPRASDNFRINMSLSLEGIGAVLQRDNEFTVVNRVVPGGPADKCGQVHAGDRITGVAQGPDSEMVDVVGWRLDDVVDLIRGPKDSIVRLQVLPKESSLDAPQQTVTITRNRIVLAEQAAQKSEVEIELGGEPMHIGVIDVPAFYLDFEARARGDADYRSTTRDVRRLLRELEAADVAGVIIDLRGNGGGSLAEATELTGLFIDSGPVVQVKDTSGRIDVNEDPNAGIAYRGPLAVLVDGGSASASEIFAGAIQDYGRGLIIGEPTYGKGTVQSIIDLDRINNGKSEARLGQLKLTIAQFFRVNGESTQHRGIVPDIIFPTAGSPADDQGERAHTNALPWSEVKAASYHRASEPLGDILEVARLRHEQRVADSLAFHLLLEERDLARLNRERKTVSLLESQRRTEWEQQEKDRVERTNRFRAACGVPPLAAGEEEPAKSDEDDPRLDVLLTETARILGDVVRTLRAPAGADRHGHRTASIH